jgi:hypothetical protein
VYYSTRWPAILYIAEAWIKKKKRFLLYKHS